MTIKEIQRLNNSPLWQALVEGKTIQMKHRDNSWEDIVDCSPYAILDAPELFRIKPEPRRIWVNFWIKDNKPQRAAYSSRDDAITDAKYYNSVFGNHLITPENTAVEFIEATQPPNNKAHE